MRIVMDHLSKKYLAIICILLGIQNVLMPELIKIVAAFGVKPRDEHELWPHLQKCEKADIFVLSGYSSLIAPAVLLDHGVPDRAEINFGRGLSTLSKTCGHSDHDGKNNEHYERKHS